MGWFEDYSFDYIKTKDKNNGANNAYDKVLGFIKHNPNATVKEIRDFILKERWKK